MGPCACAESLLLFTFSSLIRKEGRGGIVVRCWPRSNVFHVRDPTPPIPVVLGLLHAKSYVGDKRPPVGVMRKLGESMPTPASSSSSDRGSKCRCPS
ncbi:hypothetical protein AVEN_246418-1 [Araneus ventricosus]|uniref:Uncharacterized protein n=1 Tax=Araneus ventricosus TaxID=182803 RepID=A0A4Y2MRF2_ARAVE|nr:hypothetical protein AVEN_246418-1 [Araneus ventricosus]